ncbi:hypothetical protein LAZ67_15002324 [Cordylochernes scorpioides]|uniref:Reverse transcriptase Ty1/copia-type domain-containing protein n=1 Tax=Cordylochernes scorpioides TaxID=51811 RepID=A0ABY6LDN7_9ARAC|nr:hypothetical protein LAZ67_15002324 [Cordylochernes scorpioides]
MPKVQDWLKAMKCEMSSLQEHRVWDSVDLPNSVKPIKCKWIFSTKHNEDGTQKYKARLVALGCSQQVGIQYSETFSPVLRDDSFRTLLAFAALQNWKINHYDVETAYLYGKLEEITIIVNGKSLFEDLKDETGKDKWSQKDAKAQKYIMLTIEKNVLTHILNCKTSKEMYEKQVAIYQREDEQLKCKLLQEFHGFKFDKNTDMATNISRMQNLVFKLNNVKQEIEEKAL